AAGRLVEQQHLAVAHEPAGEHHLLLVAARQGAHLAVDVLRPDLECFDLLRSDLPLRRCGQEAATREASEAREADVAEDRVPQEEGLALALLGGETDACGDRCCDVTLAQRAARDTDLTA